MYVDYTGQYGRLRQAELLAEAERDHRFALPVRPRVALRIRLANLLYAIAERVDGQRVRPIVQSPA